MTHVCTLRRPYAAMRHLQRWWLPENLGGYAGTRVRRVGKRKRMRYAAELVGSWCGHLEQRLLTYRVAPCTLLCQSRPKLGQ